MSFPLLISRRLRQGALALLLAVLGLATAPAPAQVAPARGLPSLGDAGEMTALQERKLGDAVMGELYRDPDYIDDAIVGEYVDGIWQRLLAGARARGELPPELDERFAWQVLLGRDRTINAFALPGGYFGLHLGLVGVIGSGDELASVLAHELSHVTQRHIARLLGQQSRQAPMMLAAMVLGAIAASKNPQAGAALAVGGQAAVVQQQLNFSRDMEREADRVGYAILTQAGFAPQGFVAMFDRLQAASRINDNGDWPYLRSHPLTTQRIADMQQRQQLLSSNALKDAPPDLEAILISARARVLARPGVDVLRPWANEPSHAGFADQPLARRAGALYAAALAQAELRELSGAQNLAAQLAQALAAHPAALRQARLLQAELALRAGQPARALSWLSSDAAGNPAHQRATLLLRAQALTQTAQMGEAASSLRTWISEHPRDAGAWLALAHAEQAQDQPLRALRAEGEARMAELDEQGAIDRWRAAQALARQRPGAADLIEASIIDTRLREAQEILRQRKLDEERRR